MTTNRVIYQDAMEKIGVLEEGGTASSAQDTTGLNELNRMMNEWRIRDIDLNWFTQDTAADTAPLPNWAESGVIANLAVRLASEYRVPVTPALADAANTGLQAIKTVLMNVELEEGQDMSHMNQGLGIRSRYDIVNDV